MKALADQDSYVQGDAAIVLERTTSSSKISKAIFLKYLRQGSNVTRVA